MGPFRPGLSVISITFVSEDQLEVYSGSAKHLGCGGSDQAVSIVTDWTVTGQEGAPTGRRTTAECRRHMTKDSTVTGVDRNGRKTGDGGDSWRIARIAPGRTFIGRRGDVGDDKGVAHGRPTKDHRSI